MIDFSIIDFMSGYCASEYGNCQHFISILGVFNASSYSHWYDVSDRTAYWSHFKK